MPDKGALYAVYENQVARVTAKRQQQEQKKLVAATPNADARPASMSPMQQAGNDGEASQASVAETSQTTGAGDAVAVDPQLVANLLALPPQQRVLRLTKMSQAGVRCLLQGAQRAAATVVDGGPYARSARDGGRPGEP